MGLFSKHMAEVKETIKLVDVEEKYDIYFSRFFGLFFAKWGKALNLHPDHVTLLSLATGIFGAFFLYYQDNLIYASIAGVFIILSGVLDSADGQLARLTKKSTEAGRVLDGTVDTIVFLSLYIAGIAFCLQDFDLTFFVLSLASLFTHGVKTSIYEFYKSEYLRFVGKTENGHAPLQLNEVKRMGDRAYHYILHFVLLVLTSTQLTYVTRRSNTRVRMIKLSEDDPDDFADAYRSKNIGMLPLWAWVCGLNIHRNGIVICSLFGRFDVFIYGSLVWSLAVLPVSYLQWNSDRKLLLEMESR